MNKRKIEINELKKLACKGKKLRTITVKYETVLAYFKQKDSKDTHVFQVGLPCFVSTFLEQLAAVQFVDKAEGESKEPIRALQLGSVAKLESFQLKALSKEYPIQEICSCLQVEGGQKKFLAIHKAKLMSFFKHMRAIYNDFCFCAGEKVIVEQSQLRILHELFEAQWNKNEEKGRMTAIQRLQRRICRSLHFLGVLIENNILEAIQISEKRRKEEQSECGTKSQYKRNIKGVNQQVSTVHTFSSFDPSNLSVRLKSQASQQQPFQTGRNNLSHNLSQYSQKSQKIVSRSRFNLWDKAEIKQLRFKIGPEKEQGEQQTPKYQINYLSNDVENILIEQAFKIERLFTNPMEKANQYYMVDYSAQSLYPSPYPQQYNGYYVGNYNPYNYGQVIYPGNAYYPQQIPYSHQQHTADVNQLSQLKRSLGCLNLVQTRKKDKDRYQ